MQMSVHVSFHLTLFYLKLPKLPLNIIELQNSVFSHCYIQFLSLNFPGMLVLVAIILLLALMMALHCFLPSLFMFSGLFPGLILSFLVIQSSICVFCMVLSFFVFIVISIFLFLMSMFRCSFFMGNSVLLISYSSHIFAISSGLGSYFAGSLYPIFRDILQISYRQLKDLLQRCWDNIFQNVLSLKERLDRDP